MNYIKSCLLFVSRLVLSSWVGLFLFLLAFTAWKMIRILAELLSLVRTISEDIRDLRSDIRLLGSNSPLAPEKEVGAVSLESQENTHVSPDAIHGEDGEREGDDETEEEDEEKEMEELYKNLPIQPAVPLPKEVETRTGE